MDEQLDELTSREQEILGLLAEGLGNKEIARALCVTVKTIETHLHHIFQKLAVQNRVQAVTWYLENSGGGGGEQAEGE